MWRLCDDHAAVICKEGPAAKYTPEIEEKIKQNVTPRR